MTAGVHGWRRSAVLAGLLLAAAACTPAADQTATADGVTVGIRTDPSPAELGDNEFFVTVSAGGEAVTDGDIHMRLFMPGMPMSTDDTRHPLADRGKGRYQGRAEFSMGGTWRAEVEVARPGAETVITAFPFEIEWKLD